MVYFPVFFAGVEEEKRLGLSAKGSFGNFGQINKGLLLVPAALFIQALATRQKLQIFLAQNHI